MNAERFTQIIGAEFYTGVPDSQLKALCDYLMETYGIDSKHHIIAANEGNCAAIAAGYYMATKKVPVVYMQNSGEGNIINRVTSLLNKKVYGIPVIFVIGWRGEPDLHDEPQHIFQGEITTKLLDTLGIEFFTVDKTTTETELTDIVRKFKKLNSEGECAAFVIRKGALTYDGSVEYKNYYTMNREEIIRRIVSVSQNDPIISTTGKASRELFEIREENKQEHKFDFLTVGSMGHASSIALGIAENKSDLKIWCIDGDGAALMHLGAMAVIGEISPSNLIHVVINNSAHETVGGMPTVAKSISLCDIAKACGYKKVFCAKNYVELENVLKLVKTSDTLCFVEIKSSIGSRKNLGRPTTSAEDNKNAFMNYINNPAEQ